MAGNPLKTNLSNIVTAATTAASLASLVLVSPDPSSTIGYQPLNAPNSDGSPSLNALPPSLLFHYEGEQTALIESEITDHYVENNSSRQDQIALKPETVTTKGFIGELNDVLPAALRPLQTIANTLVYINAYTPSLSASALIKYTQAVFLYESASSIVDSAVSAWSSISGLFGPNGSEISPGSQVFTVGASLIQNKQQQMFQQFYGYWNTRTLFNVQTPWAIFTNMAIKSLRAIQDEETRMITDFEVSFKKIRTASTQSKVGGLLSSLFQGRSATQSAGATNLGTSSGVPGASLGSKVASSLA